jgi:hypothetical protein
VGRGRIEREPGVLSLRSGESLVRSGSTCSEVGAGDGAVKRISGNAPI